MRSNRREKRLLGKETKSREKETLAVHRGRQEGTRGKIEMV